MRELLVMAILCSCAQAVLAESEVPRDIVQLQAQASREVDNDELVAVLAAQVQGANPAELARAVNAAMAKAVKLARAVPNVHLRSGSYQTVPRYAKDGRLESWSVSQELTLESGDFPAAADLIGRLQPELHVRSMALRVSSQARRMAEDALIGEAIEAFQARADIVRRAMKAAGYRVREVTISPGATGPRPLAYAARAAGMSPVTVEPGTSQISVSVSGSIQLQ